VKTAEQPLFQGYLGDGRSVSLNLSYIVPVLVVYEIGIQLTGSDFRNAAEIILKNMRMLGPHFIRYFHLFLIALVLLCCLRVIYKERPVFRFFSLMISESLLFALLLGPLLSILIGSLFLEYPLTSGGKPDLSVSLLLSVGAGLYEELLFRFILLGGLFTVFCRVFKAPRIYSASLAVVLSAVSFAAYHHMGPHGQPLTSYVFLFRFGAGIVLGTVFITRGLGVAVYVHLFYDILRDIELALDGAG